MDNGVRRWVFFVMIAFASEVSAKLTFHKKQQSVYQSGNVVLAGLFTVHLHDKEEHLAETCSGAFNRRSYQMVQSMIFAINNINNNRTFLPNIRLGYDIKDTCGGVDDAIRAVLNFSFVKKQFESDDPCITGFPQKGYVHKQPETVAIIGPDTSDMARAVADFAGLFKVPVISPAATSIQLENRDRFKYFLRTVPSDSYQVDMIIDIITTFGWNYIIILASDNEYGRSARLDFTKKILQKKGAPVCLEIDEVINVSNDEHTLSVVEAIRASTKSKVIIFISSLHEADYFTKYARGILEGFTWIASDAWNKDSVVTTGREDLLNGMLGLSPVKVYMPAYNRYLWEIIKNSSTWDAWMEEFYEYEVNTTCVGEELKDCILKEDYETAPYQLTSTVNAVYAIAHAISDILRCDNVTCKENVSNVDWTTLIGYLHKIDFQLNNLSVSFDKHKVSNYQLWNFRKVDDKPHAFESVGVWSSVHGGQLRISKELGWNTRDKNPPVSRCSKECKAGYFERSFPVNARCCWQCSKCVGNTYTNDTHKEKCFHCPDGFWANKNKTGCIAIRQIYLNLNNYWCVALLCLSIIGNVLLLGAFVLFKLNAETPVIRASSRGLCYVVMAGTSMFFVLPLTLLFEPTIIKCKLMPCAIGLTLVVNIGTLLVKTNRIARIFSRKILRRKNTKYLGSGWQYCMVLVLICIEVIVCVIWEVGSSHETSNVIRIPLDNRLEEIATCAFGSSLIGMTIWFVFNAGLIVVCTYQAFLVRKVPNNYNEAKFIAFTMIALCISLTVYVPVYYGTVGFYRDIIASFLYVFAGSIQYICLFIPKLYILLCRPDKNVSMTPRSRSWQLSRYCEGFDSDGEYRPTLQQLSVLNIKNYRKRNCAGGGEEQQNAYTNSTVASNDDTSGSKTSR